MNADILVCGGGCAGLAAAVAAAREGAEVLLVERAGFAGGIITASGLPFFDGIADFQEKRVVTPGIPLELFARLGICAPDAKTLRPHNPQIDNLERFKWVADRMLDEQAPRLRVLYHAIVCGVQTVGTRLVAVRVASKDGLQDVEAGAIIDCTGDADVAAWSGAPVAKSDELMPMSLHFRIGNVPPIDDLAAFRRRLTRECQVLQEAGEIGMFYGPFCSFSFAPNELTFRAVRVPGDASDAADLTRAEMTGRREAWAMFERWKKMVPEFRDAHFAASGPDIGVRETRRIVGQYVFTESDISQQRPFDDAIATGCWFLDVHPPQATPGSHSFEAERSAARDRAGFQPKPYDIPYRSLVPQGVENLLVAGRGHSATRLALSSTRVTCTAMAIGQAAGLAAAIAKREGTEVGALDGRKVRRRLAETGAPVFSDAEQ